MQTRMIQGIAGTNRNGQEGTKKKGRNWYGFNSMEKVIWKFEWYRNLLYKEKPFLLFFIKRRKIRNKSHWKTINQYKGIHLEMNGTATVEGEEADRRSGPNRVWRKSKKGWRNMATSMTEKITGNNKINIYHTIDIWLKINILVNWRLINIKRGKWMEGKTSSLKLKASNDFKKLGICVEHRIREL